MATGYVGCRSWNGPSYHPTCYVEGGADCDAATASRAFPGAAYRVCDPLFENAIAQNSGGWRTANATGPASSSLGMPSLLDALAATPQLSILNKALNASGLVPSLSNQTQPVTLWAPSNAAFEAALGALNLSLTEFLASDLLVPILLRHVSPGMFTAANVTENKTHTAETLSPSPFNRLSLVATTRVVWTLIDVNNNASSSSSGSAAPSSSSPYGLARRQPIELPRPTTFQLSPAASAALQNAQNIANEALGFPPNVTQRRPMIVPGLSLADRVYALEGRRLTATSPPTLLGTSVTSTVNTTGGILQIIDGVLALPPNLLETIQSSPSFTLLALALNNTGLEAKLAACPMASGSCALMPLSILAPTNEAFHTLAAANNATARALVNQSNSDTLTKLLEFHLTHAVLTPAYLGSLKGGAELATLEGTNLTVSTAEVPENIVDVLPGIGVAAVERLVYQSYVFTGGVENSSAAVANVPPSMRAYEGVLLPIDRVLVPSGLGLVAAAPVPTLPSPQPAAAPTPAPPTPAPATVQVPAPVPTQAPAQAPQAQAPAQAPVTTHTQTAQGTGTVQSVAQGPVSGSTTRTTASAPGGIATTSSSVTEGGTMTPDAALALAARQRAAQQQAAAAATST